MKFKKLGFAVISALMLTSCGLLRPSYEYDSSYTPTSNEPSYEPTTSDPLPTTLPDTSDPTTENPSTTEEPTTSVPEPTSEPSTTEEPTTSEDSSVNPVYEVEVIEQKDSKFYYASFDGEYSLPSVTFKGYGDIPFIEFDLGLQFVGRNPTIQSNGYVYNYQFDKNTYITVDCSLDTITFHNYEKIIANDYSETAGSLVISAASACAINVNTDSSSFDGPTTVFFDLGAYNINIIAYGEYCFIPFQMFDELLLNPILGVGSAFNGDNFFINYEDYMKYNNELTEYGEAFYSGSNSQKGEKSQIEADFFYNTLCFKFDHSYGLKDWKNFNHIHDVILSMGLENDLKSTDQYVCNEALLKLIRQYIDDGHSAFTMVGNYEYYNAEKESAMMNGVTSGTRVHNLISTKSYLSQLRDAYGLTGDSYTIYNDMLVIRFDSFVVNSYDLYVLADDPTSLINTEYSGMWGLFYEALEAAKVYGGVKKVVVDLSVNGGGAAYNLIQLLGFLSTNVQLNYYHTIAGTYHNTYYAVDTNLDGSFDSNDSYQNDFDFYALTSNFSFSCGNAYPTFAREAGSAKLIGETSGGGSCIVYYSSFADGTSIQMSGPIRLSYLDNKGHVTSNEDGITPEIQIDRSNWYNYSKLRGFLN